VSQPLLEDGFELEPQIDSSFVWALEQDGVSVSSAQLPEFDDSEKHVHTSQSQEFPSLTTAGARCLAQHPIYAEDYAVLDWLRTSACHGTQSHTCKAALQSILDRRAILLQ
jgi:hypothetical protein